MRDFITIIENQSQRPSVQSLTTEVKQQIARKAQAWYDDWNQDDTGYDEMHGRGGICHHLADEIASIVGSLGVDAYSVSSNFEVHVYVVAAFDEGIFEIDIHHSVYETGGGYTWKKIPGVIFEPDDITISCLDGDPDNISEYVDNDD